MITKLLFQPVCWQGINWPIANTGTASYRVDIIDRRTILSDISITLFINASQD